MGNQEGRRRSLCHTEKEEQLQHVGTLEPGTEQQNLFQKLPGMGNNFTYNSKITYYWPRKDGKESSHGGPSVITAEPACSSPPWLHLGLLRMPFRATELWTSLQSTPGYPFEWDCSMTFPNAFPEIRSLRQH